MVKGSWWRLIVAIVAAVMMAMSGSMEGRESARAAESQGFVSEFRARGGGRCGGRTVITVVGMVDAMCYLHGILLRIVRLGGGGAESLSEVERRVARL